MERIESNYDKSPRVVVTGYDGQAWQSWGTIATQLAQYLARKSAERTVMAVDLYHGADEAEILAGIQPTLAPALVIRTAEAMLDSDRFMALIQRNLTDDRIFGLMCDRHIDDFFDTESLADLRALIANCRSGLVLVIGIGASLVCPANVLVYADMARWEIQRRFRLKTLGNWGMNNNQADFHRKYKQAFFVDWRVLDRHKAGLFDTMDFVLDTNQGGNPRMMTGEAFRAGLRQTATQPFRVVPFFDPGPWGGQWMKEVCDLDRSVSNFAWCFDCVPEENSLYLEVGGIRLEIPAIDLVLHQPVALLGTQVYQRFGAEFPIRFDFLDTMNGGNLSLQVHPLSDYIQQTFGMDYTQDESYYLLDAAPDAAVYLGLKENVDPLAMMTDLEAAQNGGPAFPDTLYVQRWPAKKHDHFLIPAGTVHCSGKNSMILEISATPFIFTFKLWDWERLGLDGHPRPIHLEHGKQVIQWDRQTEWVKKNLINRIEMMDSGPGWTEERTGLHELEFIETRRHWFSQAVLHHTGGTVNVLNLVEGREALVESPSGAFAPFTVHYAETFIIPASIDAYRIRPGDVCQGQTMATIKAWVRK